MKFLFLQKFVLGASLAAALLLIPMGVTAQNPPQQGSFTPIAPLPGTGTGASGTEWEEISLPVYVGAIFQLIIGGAAVLAVVMIVWGGFQYMAATSESGKSEGRAKIYNAALGLLIVLASFMILRLINPDLVKIHFLNKLPERTQQPQTPTPPTPTPDTNTPIIEEGPIVEDDEGNPRPRYYHQVVQKTTSGTAQCPAPQSGYEYFGLGSGVQCQNIDMSTHACCRYELTQ